MTLCYHAVSERWGSDLAVTLDQLDRQLSLFSGRGYRGVTFAELEAARRRGDASRLVAVTFDDGFRSILRARPVLERHGFRATVFVVTKYVSTDALFDWPGVAAGACSLPDELRSVSWDDCRALQRAGWEIGSHTVTHPVLTEIDERDLEGELAASRATIMSELGECTSVAYPYGRANKSVAAAADAAGYLHGCTLGFAAAVDTPLLRPRVGIVRSDGDLRVRVKTHPVVGGIRRSSLAPLAERIGLARSSRLKVDD